MNKRAIKKVMLIDDDRLTNFMNASLIKKTGICREVVVFENGTDSLNYLKLQETLGEKLPEIILIDINLPDTDGHKLIQGIQSLESFFHHECMLVYLTNSQFYLDLIKADANDIEYFLKKPLNKEHLLRLKEEFLRINQSFVLEED